MFRFREKLLRFGFGDFIGVVGTIEGCKAFEVYGRPSMFSLEKFIDFTL